MKNIIKHFFKILLIILLLIPFINKTGAFLDNDLGLDLYKNLDLGLEKLEKKEFSYELSGQKDKDISKNLNRIFKNNGEKECIKEGVSLNEVLEASYGEDYGKLTDILTEKCIDKKNGNISVLDLNKYQNYLKIIRDTYKNKSKKKTENIYEISRVALYNDGIKENSPFDLIVDLEDINKIFFTDEIKYNKENKDFLSDYKNNETYFKSNSNNTSNDKINKLLNGVLPSNKNAIPSFNLKGAGNNSSGNSNSGNNSSGNSNSGNNSSGNSNSGNSNSGNNSSGNNENFQYNSPDGNNYICSDDNNISGLNEKTNNILKSYFNEQNNNLKNSSGGSNNGGSKNGGSNNGGSKNGGSNNGGSNNGGSNNGGSNNLQENDNYVAKKLSNYKGVNDNAVWPCNKYFCIKHQLITHKKAGVGDKMKTIEDIVNNSNEHFKDGANTSLVQAKMTTNNFELGLKDLSFVDSFSMPIVISKKAPPILETEDIIEETKNTLEKTYSSNSKLPDSSFTKKRLLKIYKNMQLDYDRKNDIKIFNKSDFIEKIQIDSLGVSPLFSANKQDTFNRILEEKIKENDYQENTKDKEINSKIISEFYKEFLELEKSFSGIYDYVEKLYVLVVKLREIPISTS